ncbi:hypothetical protein Skr01_29780 [Sphaerisporangium krabiense]|nr:hypothetical protein Skr01_29780 [Sphaerisporangium krabiense]
MRKVRVREYVRRLSNGRLVTVRAHIRRLPTRTVITAGAVLTALAIVVLVVSALLPDSTPEPSDVAARSQTTAAPAPVTRAYLAAELRRLREGAGLSAANAGRRAGIDEQRVTRIESGGVRPTARDVSALCEAYELSPEERNRLMFVQYQLDR